MCRAQVELCNEAGTLTYNTDGSFYCSSDLRYGESLGELTTWIKRLNETLEAEGTLLVPTPRRGMVNGEIVTGTAALEALNINFDGGEAHTYYQDYIASLAPVGAVDLISTTEMLTGGPLEYQQFDRHWTSEGAKVSAQGVAFLLANPTYQVLTGSRSAEFATTLTGTEPGGNEIFELIEEKCGDLPDAALGQVSLYETKRLDEGDLFADEIPVVA